MSLQDEPVDMVQGPPPLEGIPEVGPGTAITHPGEPPRLARWVLAVLLLLAYGGVQFAIVIPVVILMMLSGEVQTDQDLLNSSLFAWTGIVSIGLAALTTIVAVLLWLQVWRWLFPTRPFTAAVWLAWRKPVRLRLWMIPVMMFPCFAVMLFAALYAEIQQISVQVILFRTGTLRVITTAVVTTVVPVAEELIFRGALYNALLPRAQEGMTVVERGLRHVMPFTITTLLFATMHVLSGFVAVGPIIQITMLSVFLGGLRALSGSVQTSVVGHVLWNAFNVVAMLVVNNPPDLPFSIR